VINKYSSEQLMALLNELAGMKTIDSVDRPQTRLERAARKERQLRRVQIGRQIKQIAKKEDEER
jgi:hypothetical protein